MIYILGELRWLRCLGVLASSVPSCLYNSRFAARFLLNTLRSLSFSLPVPRNRWPFLPRYTSFFSPPRLDLGLCDSLLSYPTDLSDSCLASRLLNIAWLYILPYRVTLYIPCGYNVGIMRYAAAVLSLLPVLAAAGQPAAYQGLNIVWQDTFPGEAGSSTSDLWNIALE